MNKADFVAYVADQLKSSTAEASRSIAAVTAAMKEVFITQESLILPGFGKLGVKKRAARSGRNPSTGETIHIAETLIPFVRISPKIKNLLNQTNSTKISTKGKK